MIGRDSTPLAAIARDGAVARFALTATELRRCAELPTRRRRSDYRAGRLAAKRAAGGLLGGLPRRRIEVITGRDGPPTVGLLDGEGIRRPAEVELSISHRDGRAVAAVAPPGVRIGVDLELAASVPRRMARHFLTDVEAKTLEDVAGWSDPTVLWAFKEASWKALGLGRSVPFKALSLCWDRDGVLRGVRIYDDVFLPVHYRLGTPWPGYHVAVVWMSGGSA